MEKHNVSCPKCKSKDVRFIETIKEDDYYLCNECENCFLLPHYAESGTNNDPEKTRKSVFYREYIKINCKELQEREHFKGQKKICADDKIDLQIDFYLLEKDKTKNDSKRKTRRYFKKI